MVTRLYPTDAAHRIAESVILVFESLVGPLLPTHEIEVILRLPFSACSSRRKILIAEDLVEAALANKTTEMWPHTLCSEILRCSFVDDRPFGLAWALTPKVLELQLLHDALAFYSASIRRFYVWNVDIPNYFGNDPVLGQKRAELALAEGAFQDAYKSIEAVVGDPGNGGKRFLSRLEARGIPKDELIGFESRGSLSETIQALNKTRDKRAARGRTSQRGLSILGRYQRASTASSSSLRVLLTTSQAEQSSIGGRTGIRTVLLATHEKRSDLGRTDELTTLLICEARRRRDVPRNGFQSRSASL